MQLFLKEDLRHVYLRMGLVEGSLSRSRDITNALNCEFLVGV